MGTFQPPPLTPSPPRQGQRQDSHALAEEGFGQPRTAKQDGHANGTRCNFCHAIYCLVLLDFLQRDCYKLGNML